MFLGVFVRIGIVAQLMDTTAHHVFWLLFVRSHCQKSHRPPSPSSTCPSAGPKRHRRLRVRPHRPLRDKQLTDGGRQQSLMD